MKYEESNIEDRDAVAVRVKVLGNRVIVNEMSLTTLVDLQLLPYMMGAEKFSDTTGKSYSVRNEVTCKSTNRHLLNLSRIRTRHNDPAAVTKREFYRKCSLPNIVGAIDGTLVPIVAPTENEEVYVCRKGFHALNCQAVSSPDLQ
ncbi:hypothetical protein DPMN_127390 [Dreissena polymorpha]|uniref:Uncharacterized protein n=1 Tax=Dreissena polymorpha TaxID=45954 RepID=A0A9D4JZ36_DREPO|nr:hypothetical protein DPMN_127390 [Dreissena polymorpha]